MRSHRAIKDKIIVVRKIDEFIQNLKEEAAELLLKLDQTQAGDGNRLLDEIRNFVSNKQEETRLTARRVR